MNLPGAPYLQRAADGALLLDGHSLAELGRADDPRFREIMSAAVRHLHAFVREARLTEAEFFRLCAAIARAGQLTTASHNEVVLGAGSLGVGCVVLA